MTFEAGSSPGPHVHRQSTHCHPPASGPAGTSISSPPQPKMWGGAGELVACRWLKRFRWSEQAGTLDQALQPSQALRQHG